MDAETGGSAGGVGGSTSGSVNPTPGAGGIGGVAPGAGGGARNPNSQYISVTPQEREAIDRVKIQNFGFMKKF